MQSNSIFNNIVTNIFSCTVRQNTLFFPNVHMGDEMGRSEGREEKRKA
jgi:hypothetical protein